MIPQGSNCVPQLFSPTCSWKLRGVPQALWNHGFQHALLSETGFKACVTGVVSANVWTQRYYLINWLWSDSLETDSGRDLHGQKFIRKCFWEIHLWGGKVLELSRGRDWAAMQSQQRPQLIPLGSSGATMTPQSRSTWGKRDRPLNPTWKNHWMWAEPATFHGGWMVAGELTVTSNLSVWAHESLSTNGGYLSGTLPRPTHQLSMTIISGEFIVWRRCSVLLVNYRLWGQG